MRNDIIVVATLLAFLINAMEKDVQSFERFLEAIRGKPAAQDEPGVLCEVPLDIWRKYALPAIPVSDLSPRS
jgi:hypothetical protein